LNHELEVAIINSFPSFFLIEDMGIKGLLQVLSSITETCHVKEYRGLRVAVDGYGWMHKAIYSCSRELALGIETEAFVRWFEHRVGLLLHHGVIPVVVFDGANLPAKSCTEAGRKANRISSLAEARSFEERGDKEGARNMYSRCVDVTCEMVYKIIIRLRVLRVEFIVAPYEADAQIAYLAREGLVDAVISEDSDMLPYSCQRVLFKMDAEGSGKEIQLNKRLSQCEELPFRSFSPDMFLNFCILSGCDYLPSFEGMGISKAHETVRLHGKKGTDALLAQVGFLYSGRIPVGYAESFKVARMTFLHQRVFDPRTQSLTTVTPLAPGLIEKSSDKRLDFLGPFIDNQTAASIANGNVDPSTMKPYICISQSSQQRSSSNKEISSDLQKALLLTRGVSKSLPKQVSSQPILAQPSISSFLKATLPEKVNRPFKAPRQISEAPQIVPNPIRHSPRKVSALPSVSPFFQHTIDARPVESMLIMKPESPQMQTTTSLSQFAFAANGPADILILDNVEDDNNDIETDTGAELLTGLFQVNGSETKSMNSASRRISDTFGSPLVGRRTTSTGRGSAVSTSCTRHVPLIATSIDFKRFEHGEKQNSTVVSVSPTRKQRPSAQKQSSATSADVNRKRPSSVAIEDVFEIDSQKKIKTSKLPNRSVLAPASPSRDLNATDQIPLEEVAMTTSGLLRFVLPS
jgi:5'-3' exonuclease